MKITSYMPSDSHRSVFAFKGSKKGKVFRNTPNHKLYNKSRVDTLYDKSMRESVEDYMSK